MSLAVIAEQSFSRNARGRGLEYFEDGAVHGLERTANGVRAIVAGTSDYDVTLTLDGNALQASCTCPYFEENLQNCKHIWAALLAADASQSLRIDGTTAIAVVPWAPPAPNTQPARSRDLFGERADTPPFPVRPPQPRRPPPRPAAPPRWQVQLGQIAALSPHADLRDLPFDPDSLLYSLLTTASNGEELIVAIMTRERKANGDWARPRAARLPEHVIRALPPGPDRDILERLLGARTVYDWSPYGAATEISRVRLDGVVARDLLPALCETGRFVAALDAEAPEESPSPFGERRTARKSARPVQYLPLAWDEGGTWRLQLDIRRHDANRAYDVTALFTRDDERMDVAEPIVVSAAGIW